MSAAARGQWEALARLVGGALQRVDGATLSQALPPGMGRSDSLHRLHFEIDGCRMVAMLGERRIAGRPHPGRHLLHVAVPAPAAGHLRLDVAHGYVYPLFRALGMQDELVGDAHFDDRFRIKTNDVTLMRLWLDAPVRHALGPVDGFALRVRNRSIVGSAWGHHPRTPEPVAAGLRAVAALATLPARLARTWRVVAGELGGRFRGDEAPSAGFDDRLVLQLGVGLATVRVVAVLGGLGGGRRPRGVATVVRATRTTVHQDPFLIHRGLHPAGELRRLPQVASTADYVWRGGDAATQRARATPRRGAELVALAPAAVTGNGSEIAAWVDGFVEDAARLQGLARLVTSIAQEVHARAGGPYR